VPPAESNVVTRHLFARQDVAIQKPIQHASPIGSRALAGRQLALVLADRSPSLRSLRFRDRHPARVQAITACPGSSARGFIRVKAHERTHSRRERDPRADSAVVRNKAGRNRSVRPELTSSGAIRDARRVRYRRRESASSFLSAADASRVTSARKLRSRMAGGKVQAASEFSKMNGEAVTKFARAAIFHGG